MRNLILFSAHMEKSDAEVSLPRVTSLTMNVHRAMTVWVLCVDSDVDTLQIRMDFRAQIPEVVFHLSLPTHSDAAAVGPASTGYMYTLNNLFFFLETPSRTLIY